MEKQQAEETPMKRAKRQRTNDKKARDVEDLFGPRQTINRYMQCRKRRTSQRQLEKNQLPAVFTEKGSFGPLPLEVIFRILKYIPLVSLGSFTLTSKNFRNTVLMYVYSKEGSDRVVPAIKSIPDADDLNSKEYKNESKCCHEHYKQLGIMLKRSTCLFSTRERLSQVGQILDKLRDSHVKICTELGSDLAYSCYGIFLHAFIAGWEDDEKVKAFQAIKGASLLEERILHVMKAKPGNLAGYERYVRVFCREIFLNRACPPDRSFWTAQILKPYPICFQARLLYILYGPTDTETEDLVWEEMAMTSDIVTHDLQELANGMQILQSDSRGLWSADDLISIFDELTLLSRDWDIENVAIFLKFCGDSLCCEVLGNKAINGRMSELSYLLYYIWQYCSRSNQSGVTLNKEQEWFVALLQHLGRLLPRSKDHHTLINQMFNVWEECMMETLDDNTQIPDSQQSLQEEERHRFRESLRSISSLSTTLLVKEMKL